MDNNIQANPQPQQGQQPAQPQYIIVKQQSNPVGLTGFILTLVALVVTFIPVLQYANVVLVPLALLCCLIGLFKKPRAFAVIGLIIHLILIGLVATCVGGLAAIASAS